MAVKLVIPGVQITPAPQEPLFAGDPGELSIQVLHAARVELGLRGAVADVHTFDKAEDTDIVEIEWEGGVREWMSVGQLRTDLATQGTAPPSRSAPAMAESLVNGAVHIPAAMPRGPRTRGATGWIIKGLQILRVNPVSPLANLAVAEVVRRFEDKQQFGPGLYPVPESLVLQENSFLKPGELTGEGPFLVFLHGTASNTQGSFGKLAGTSEWLDLRKRYGKNIYALQHYTLSVSPIQNAIDLLTVLPAGARLHLVSHSRGGLIGELVCRGTIAESDLAPFAARPDLPLFRELAALSRDKRPRVERFIRVACPARGTILASQRLDRYLSILLNLFGLIPALKVSLLYDILKATLLEVARRRTEPDELPGLEAQMPESPIIHLLNRSGVTTADELGVIAGDVQGQGFWKTLTVFATDLFYREDHDLVVNTRSMYGGAARQSTLLFFDKGPDVNHFSYFANLASRSRLHAWLTREGPAELFAPTAGAASRGAAPVLARAAAALPADAPVVFLIPDFLGSELRDAQGTVWPDTGALSLGGIARLGIERRVEPGTLLPEVYGDLAAFLAQRFRVLPFAYDWRQSVLEEGQRLAGDVRAQLEQGARSVSFVGHGLGGLVVRGMIARDADLWAQVREREGRLVMLGTPNHGTLFAARLLLGREPLLSLLDLLDIARRPVEITAILARWPGLLEMLPSSDDLDLLDPSIWEGLSADGGHATPAAADLENAREARQRLDGLAASAEGLFHVAGRAPWTPLRLAAAGGRLVFDGTSEGDGRVADDFGRLAGVPTWYAGVPHGELTRLQPASKRPAFHALLELLERGDTRLLPNRSPGGQASISLPEPVAEPPLFPDAADLRTAALGLAEAAAPTADLLTLRVGVVHGDLVYARFPLAIGHYENDTIVSAEKVLDRSLGGALLERYRLGLYPGSRGTVEVVDKPGASPSGALIIGLGEVGKVTQRTVAEGVALAALRYALAVAVRPAIPAADGPGDSGAVWRSAAFSSVLIGAGTGRSLSVEESVAAVVRGAVEANRSLRNQGLWDRVRIDEVEFIELYEPIAIRAARTLLDLTSFLRIDLDLSQERIEAAPTLRCVPGGRVRLPASEYATGWWRRLQITREGRERLSFEVLTERARTEKTRLFLQSALVDRYVSDASGTARYDRLAAETLFELLLPNSYKDEAHEETDQVLILDEATAQYPWELLAERARCQAEPFATRAGLIRQLKTREGEFRPVVRAPQDRYALVVGDPVSDLVDLPGAQSEAKEVRRMLEMSAYEAGPDLIRADGWTIVKNLFVRDYQILHLAGHGRYDAKHPEESGMVIGEGLVLNAGVLRQLRTVPPFVFINCCHLGTIDRRYSSLAASISSELIRMGARAIVAAGWAVEDDLATLFARELYAALLSGKRFGAAVLHARREAHAARPESNTWGAYQCYGDPDYALDLRAADKSGQTGGRTYVAPREVLDELTGFRGEACQAFDSSAREALRRRLDDLDLAIPEEWRGGEILAALAEAHGDLGDWEKAIEIFTQAIKTWGADVPIRAVQVLANLEIRLADRMRRGGEAAADDGQPAVTPDELIDRATGRLSWLLELGKTPERLSLVGSAYKRIALAAQRAGDRQKALRKAAESYREAHELTLAAKRPVNPYPALNWIACLIALGNAGKDKEKMLALIAQCESEGARLAERDPSFYHRLHGADALLHRHLIEGDLLKIRPAVAECYRRVLAKGAGATEASSVTEHLDFLAEMLRKKSADSAAALEALRRDLALAVSGKG
jgi:tetratricopeptide (TPR) repeat protein